MFKPGDTPIPGYQLVRFIGRGAYGEVWEAQAPGGAQAALKFIPLQTSAGGVELKAANAVKLIRHANLIPLTAIWVLDRMGNVLDDQALELIDQDHLAQATIVAEDLERKQSLAYLVIAMALADECLEAQFKRYREEGKTGIPVDILLEYTRDAAKGLDFLNEPRHLVDGERVGIVHRDIKPANLLLLGDSVVVGDFGVATSLRDFDVQATRVVGSLAFMAPESLSCRPTPSTDQYALAITYYYLRTGEMPFDDGHTFDSLAQVHKEGLLDFSSVPEPERAVLTKATAVPSTPRYPNCTHFVSALSSACQIESEVSPRKRLPLVSIALTALAVLALGALAPIFWPKFPENENNAASTFPEEPKPVLHQIEFIPPANFELQVLGNGSKSAGEKIQFYGTAELELNPGEKVNLSAHADSPLFEPLEETLSYEQLDQMDWQVNLVRKSGDVLREQAFKLANENNWNEATELLRMAAKDQPKVLELPAPIRTTLGRKVMKTCVGKQNYVASALATGGRTSFRFKTINQSLLKKWFATASATDSSNDETDEPDWVETDLVGVQKIFPTIEPDQWLVVMTNSIGQIDRQGQYKQLWDDDSEELSFSTAAVSHDGRWLACGDYSGTVHLWQVAMDGSLNDYEKFEAHQELVLSLNFVGEQNVLFSTATDCSMAQWKISNEGTEHETIPIDTSAMDSNEELIGVTETSEDRLIVATEKQLWATDLGSKTLKSIFPSQIDAMISIVRASPKSNWILLGTDSEITPVQLLNLKDQTVVFPELPMLASLAAGTFSENGQMIAASGYKGETILINLATDKPTWWDLPKLTGGYRKFIAFTSGGKYLITLDERGGEEIWPVDHLRLILQTQTEVYAVSPER